MLTRVVFMFSIEDDLDTELMQEMYNKACPVFVG